MNGVAGFDNTDSEVQGELRSHREARLRLDVEVDALRRELARAREEKADLRAHARELALSQANAIGALRADAAQAQAQASTLAAQLEYTRAANEMEVGRELQRLRADQVSLAESLRELQSRTAAALAGIPRGKPLLGAPAGLPSECAHDYLILSTSALMDPSWYLARNADVAMAGMDPVLHYLTDGWREGRSPGPAFDGEAYLAANPDVKTAGLNPLVHFQQFGPAELRALMPRLVPAVSVADPVAGALTVAPTPLRRTWFYVGDLIEWLNDHAHFTGVGRVTTELLFAFMLETDDDVGLCVATGSGLCAVSDASFLDDAGKRIGRPSTAAKSRLISKIVQGSDQVAAGDHVIFTGVVWTDFYSQMFKHLSENTITYSLLIHDIIPLQSPEELDNPEKITFSDWLTISLETALTIFVSNHVVAEDISRWAVANRVNRRAVIAPIRFGYRRIGGEAQKHSPITNGVDLSNFALCVGTIDRRKNQQRLVEAWRMLLEEYGPQACPQLVFVGRDDLELGKTADVKTLQHANKVLILTGRSDAELSTLFDACAFTVFPSLWEGYGLPVAESLAHGKLCICSDLPAIRTHAGDLAWYFDPQSISSMQKELSRAIRSPGDVSAANLEIASAYVPGSWDEALFEMLRTIREVTQNPHPGPQPRTPAEYAGDIAARSSHVLARAAEWCVNLDPNVSVVIVNWNAANLSRDCIRQLWSATEGVTYEILIADNGSREEEIEPLRHLGKGVRTIEIGCNRFFGEANNIAAEQAKGRFLCFLNGDAFVQPGWLKVLCGAFDRHPRAGASGPVFLYPDGRVQEAGGFVNEEGFPTRGARGDAHVAPGARDAVVDYISAATLVVERDLFVSVGGFDLAYEPAYYEDTDFCFKLKAAGRDVVLRPDAKVVHIEGAAANGDPDAELRRKHLGDLNRAKFAARWREYLRTRDADTLVHQRGLVSKPLSHGRSKARRAIVFTPEPLTPGGGERYLLTLASVLLHQYDVTLVTPHPYSRIRILDLATTFGLNLDNLSLSVAANVEWDAVDLQVTMGNYVVPPVHGRALTNLYHCQFPFPLPSPITPAQRMTLLTYDEVVVNSRYTALHFEASLHGLQLAEIPVRIIAPPSRLIDLGKKAQDPIRVLSVGRFFQGGHSKLQHKLISVFKRLLQTSKLPLDLHLAGSSHPAPENMDYLSELIESAKGYPIWFHVNASDEEIKVLYQTSTLYWHAAGLGKDLIAAPWAAEHFGISIVEAMSSGSIPFALASGGAREVIRHGIDGFLYDSEEALLKLSFRYQECLSSILRELPHYRRGTHRSHDE